MHHHDFAQEDTAEEEYQLKQREQTKGLTKEKRRQCRYQKGFHLKDVIFLILTLKLTIILKIL